MSKGKARSRDILEVGRRILVEQGYKGLTLRNVALAVGISVGNLHYYFRTKEDLQREVLRCASEREIIECCAQYQKSTAKPKERFLDLIRFLLARVDHTNTRGLHLQGWALAAHDNHAEHCMEQLYQSLCRLISLAIEVLNARLDANERMSRATLIHAMIAGSIFSLVAQGKRLVKRPGLDVLIEARALQLAMTHHQRGNPGKPAITASGMAS